MRLREMDPQGVVAFFPSDHYFANNEAFTEHINIASVSAEARPDMVVVLGIMPDSPEVEYGWIEPGPVISYHAICRVNRFWEKPSQTLASDLLARGCVWNSFIMAGHVQVFLDLIRRTLPFFYRRFESISPLLFSAGERDAVERLYSVLHPINCSHGVLSVRTDNLAVLCGTGLGWSDLGEPK